MNDDIRKKVEHFFSTYPMVEYPKEQILVFPGESVEKVYFIETGRVCQYDVSYRGDEVVVNTFKPPAFFSMALAINHEKSRFFYKTEITTQARIAPANDVVKFLKANPDVMYDLLSRLYRGIDAVLDRMVHLMSGTAKSRVLFELVIECKRFGKFVDNRHSIGISETSIAARSGLSRETVSREIKRLKEKGLVEMKFHKIYINDLAELENQVGEHI